MNKTNRSLPLRSKNGGSAKHPKNGESVQNKSNVRGVLTLRFIALSAQRPIAATTLGNLEAYVKENLSS